MPKTHKYAVGEFVWVTWPDSPQLHGSKIVELASDSGGHPLYGVEYFATGKKYWVEEPQILSYKYEARKLVEEMKRERAKPEPKFQDGDWVIPYRESKGTAAMVVREAVWSENNREWFYDVTSSHDLMPERHLEAWDPEFEDTDSPWYWRKDEDRRWWEGRDFEPIKVEIQQIYRKVDGYWYEVCPSEGLDTTTQLVPQKHLFAEKPEVGNAVGK